MATEILMLLFACVVTNNVGLQGIGMLEVQNPKKNFGFVALVSGSICLMATLTALVYYFIQNYFLAAFELQFMKIFILTVLVGMEAFAVSAIVRKMSKEIYFLFDKNYSFLNLIAITVGILLTVDFSASLLMVVLNALFLGIGFMLINFMFYAYEDRIQTKDVNVAFRSLPITMFIVAFIGMLFYAISMLLI